MAEKIIGIIGAMPEEISGILELVEERKDVVAGRRTYHIGVVKGIKVVVAFSRWGKVAAAITASHLINQFKISHLVFVGVAGAIADTLDIGDLVIGERLIQHDMDARPLMSRFEIPLLGVRYFESDKTLVDLVKKSANEMVQGMFEKEETRTVLSDFIPKRPDIHSGEVASGDKFFSVSKEKEQLKIDLPGVLCVEMEGAAVAQVCYEHDIPFIVVRTISDKSGEEAHVDFTKFITHVAGPYGRELVRVLLKSISAI